MKILISTLTVAAMLAFPSADASDRKAECSKAKAKIRKLQSRMRQGYTAKQGVRWQEELRRQKRIRARVCR